MPEHSSGGGAYLPVRLREIERLYDRVSCCGEVKRALNEIKSGFSFDYPNLGEPALNLHMDLETG